MNQPVYLSWGMGVESSAILARWIMEPESRDFPLDRLTVITAQTGDEWSDTKALCEEYMFPLLRAHGVRLVQVARAGHLEEDGIEVLDDTREPYTLYIDGAYKLSDELALSGTVPTFGGVHKCALKFKAFVLESWLAAETEGGPYRHAFGFNSEERGRVERSNEYNLEVPKSGPRMAFGFNADEGSRIERASEYDSMRRVAFFPLMDWGWDRARCVEYLLNLFGVEWLKSACVQCPFVKLTEESVGRMRRAPAEIAKALLLEYRALCLNPRATLYSGRSLMSVIERDGNDAALGAFYEGLETLTFGLYRVRRIYTAKGKAYRCVELLGSGDRTEAARLFEERAAALGLEGRVEHDIAYGYALEREEGVYPTREEFYVTAPADVAPKARYGFPWFEQKWDKGGQAALFG